jgi:hypothetical protein
MHELQGDKSLIYGIKIVKKNIYNHYTHEEECYKQLFQSPINYTDIPQILSDIVVTHTKDTIIHTLILIKMNFQHINDLHKVWVRYTSSSD